MLNRRKVLAAAGALAAVTALPAAAGPPALRDLAAARGLLFGTAAGSYQLKDADFQSLLVREASILVPEYEQVREHIEPKPGIYDFAGTDLLTSFAAMHRIAMHGHTLVWYAANPPWLEEKVLNAPDDEIIVDYITRVMKRYRGAYRSWDVVNEAILPSDGRPDGLRNCAWLKRFGPGYIDTAFQAAKAADPGALLVYSDWGCEGGEAWNDGFRAKTLQLLSGAKARGIPIEAYGMQGHLDAFGPPIDQKKLGDFLASLQAMGLKVLVTELDADDSKGTRDIAVRDQAAADQTARFLDVVLDSPATTAVLTWGLTDRYLHKPEWIPDYVPRKLPFDASLKPKPMAQAIARALARR